jgi:hypothetical protein
MDGFKKFAADTAPLNMEAPLTHLPHVEDPLIDGGNDGVFTTSNFLDDAHRMLSGYKPKAKYTVKFDGAPSLVFGIHPAAKKFFVSTKSAFSRNPKLNFNIDDIYSNYPDSEGLAEKLSAALKYLPNILPDDVKPGEIWQGDVLYTADDVQSNDEHHAFTPNTITYMARKDSQEGQRVSSSKFGIAVHTKYTRRGIALPIEDDDIDRFTPTPLVNLVDTKLRVDAKLYTSDEMTEFLKHRDEATKLYGDMEPEALDVIQKYAPMIMMYVNSTVRANSKPGVEGLIDFIDERNQASMDRLTTERGRKNKAGKHSETISDILSNKENVENAFKLHGHLQDAKNVLTAVMAKNNPWKHSIAGEPTKPEGVVATMPDGQSVKFVDRAIFSRNNFLKGAFRKQNGTNV